MTGDEPMGGEQTGAGGQPAGGDAGPEETTVAWTAIEPHWKVISADGYEIGEVFLPAGDENADIFDGLEIAHHGGPAFVHNWRDRPRYVSQDKVASIQPGHVRLTMTAEEARDLPESDVPETAQILPDKASLWERFRSEVEKLTHEDRTY
jgi:hypothetical protein